MCRGKKKKAKKARAAAADLGRIEGELRKALDTIAAADPAKVKQAAKGMKQDALAAAKGKKKKRGGKKKLILLAAIGALIASEDLRGKVLDALFGAEEEFQYTPPAAGG